MSEQNTEHEPIALPPRMQEALEQYRKRVWTIKLAEGALAAVFGLIVSYLLVFLLDRFFDTPGIIRAILLLAGSAGTIILFPLKWHNWVWRHRNLDQVARLLRHKYPRFGDHLMGIIELAQAESRPGASRVLVEAAIRQVDKELGDRDLTDAVPNPLHRRWAWAAGVPLLIGFGVMIMIPAAGGNALLRWLLPLGDTERYTFAQLDGDAGIRYVPYAEPFNINAILNEESPWKPESATARYARQKTITATREGDGFRFDLPPQTTDGIVKIRIGDAKRIIFVEPKMRPALNDLIAEVKLPDYLQREEPVVEDVRGGTVSLVLGSTAVFIATATRNLAEATFNDRSQQVEGAQITTEPVDVDASKEFSLAWRDEFGLTARKPQLLRVEARDDQSPNVNINKLKNNQVVLSTEVLAFEVQASDDFGVKQVGLEWIGIQDPIQNPEPSEGEKIVSAGAPTNETMLVPATFSAVRENIRPQSMRIRAFAEDYLPNRERAYSPYLILHVLTPEDHFNWLINQMNQWANASIEVYDKELQLNETNKELMALPPDALDDPAQRKKIQEQAAAEKANAATLDALIDIGKELVQEATKNEEFEGEQLNAWAEMLKTLGEIAAQKMPSVADLLAKAAEAKGQPANPTDPPMDGDHVEQPTENEPKDNPPVEGPAAPPGGVDHNFEKADKYGPDAKDIQGLDKEVDDPNTPGGEVNVDRSKPADGKPGYIPANPTPLVLDHESGFNKPEKAGGAPQIVGGLGIPVTLLKGSGRDDDDEEPEEASTAELILEAVTEQQELLDAFAKLAADMNQLLLGFENSTFVKRLKAASRNQIDLAVELNTIDGFGMDLEATDTEQNRTTLASRETAESQRLFTIQEDMVAYADRRPTLNYTRVLKEMQFEGAVNQISDIAAVIHANNVGQSTIEAEYWADTLDRWAEQLVNPLPPPSGPPSSGMIVLPNLPPHIILEVLRILNSEIDLREETRELHQARDAMEEENYTERGTGLSTTQTELAVKSRELVKMIEDLPKARELTSQSDKLTNAAVVMDEVEGLLAEPKTGPPTIAAIIEVIEILLETARLPNAPMVVKAAPTETSALVLMGLGDDESKAFIENRAPALATGKTGRKLPEEYRQGLDTYLNALEGKAIE